MMRSWKRPLILTVVLLLAAAGCAPTRRVEPTGLVWPPSPVQPRIKYLQSIYGEDDIGRPYSFFEFLFGKGYDDKLYQPYGVSARRNKLLVTDLQRQNVLLFDLEKKQMSFVDHEGILRSPSAAVEDSAGNIYVANAADNRIVVFDASSSVRGTFTIGDGRPVALALNEALGRLYIVDRQKHRVVVMDTAGKELFVIGGPGVDDGRFNIPLSIALDAKGTVYVLDTGNFRVQAFTPDGKFLTKFGSPGDQHGQFSNPKGIAVDSENHIYVTDAAFSNFQILTNEGDSLLSIGRLGSSPGYLYLPCGIAIDEQDRIFIADRMNGRIQVFQYLRSPQ